MKRLVILFPVLLLAFGMFFTSCGDKEDDQEETVFVSTTQQSNKVLLEAFTGVKCGYCPDGHKRAQDVLDNYPGKVLLYLIILQAYLLLSLMESIRILAGLGQTLWLRVWVYREFPPA